MISGQPEDPDNGAPVEPHVIIEVNGPNIVVRATSHVDRAYTTSLADVINAASETDTCVVIDPKPIRCDDGFSTYKSAATDLACTLHTSCRPVGADTIRTGIVRLRADESTWLLDVANGMLCQASDDVDPQFLCHDAWRPIVAVCITPRRLIALNVNGTQTSAARAHHEPPKSHDRRGGAPP